MARSTRPMLSVPREPGGRRARAAMEPELAPLQIKRLRDAALAGLQREEWGSELGRLLLTGRIGPDLYAAGRRWAECTMRYRAALGAPPPHPPPIPFERANSAAPPDPASEAGARLTARERAAVQGWREAHSVLREGGTLAERVVRSVCEQDQTPCGAREFEALARGLRSLAHLWRMTDPGRTRA
jgi:hypothetical protein